MTQPTAIEHSVFDLNYLPGRIGFSNWAEYLSYAVTYLAPGGIGSVNASGEPELRCPDAWRPVLLGLRQIFEDGRNDPVLITGATGVGKEAVARLAHLARNPREPTKHPFVVAHLPEIGAGVLESALFGHVKGAFTDAAADRTGLVELANGGTLFLDEIGEIDRPIQNRLMRVVERQVVTRVGSTTPKELGFMAVSATSRDLSLESAQLGDAFRTDFFMRLARIQLRIPPLAERRADLPSIIAALLREMPRSALGEETTKILSQLPWWQGNIRDLRTRLGQVNVLVRTGAPEDAAATAVATEAFMKDRLAFQSATKGRLERILRNAPHAVADRLDEECRDFDARYLPSFLGGSPSRDAPSAPILADSSYPPPPSPTLPYDEFIAQSRVYYRRALEHRTPGMTWKDRARLAHTSAQTLSNIAKLTSDDGEQEDLDRTAADEPDNSRKL